MTKRLFDIVVSGAALVVFSPLLILIAILVRATSSGPAFFKQVRMGRHFKPFEIYKFRSMVQDAPEKGPQITVGADHRITSIGTILRKTKLDELPQLLNVFKGEMSFVGPRPEVARYVEMFREDYVEILRMRPGITDLASLEFRHESEILAAASDPEKEYCEQILPTKIALSKQYIASQSLWFDFVVLMRTGLAIFTTHRN